MFRTYGYAGVFLFMLIAFAVILNGGISLDENAGNTPTPTPGNGGNPASSCGGKYNLSYPFQHLNFGDPACNFTKSDLYTLLKQTDPANADYWFFTVIPCESGYDPDAINPNSPDPSGAWGLYQMGRGKNGQYDHGDVIWQTQTSNAVNYNNNLIANGIGWRYWACASSRW